MSDEINTTQGLSPRDFAMTLRSLSDADLETQLETQFWCSKHLQNQEIDYHARYLACRVEDFTRHMNGTQS